MATSGSFETNQYSNRGLIFSWSRTGYDIAGNYSDISWELKGNGSKSGYYMAGAFKVVIDGETVYSSSDRIQLWNGTVVKTGTKRIYHNNDGTRSFSASAEAGIYTYAVNCSGSGSWSLDTIPRYADITRFDLSAVDETTIQFTWQASASCDAIQYSVDGGGWTGGQYPTTNIGGLSAGNQHSVKIRVKRSDSQLWTESDTKYATTYDYPKPTSINDFNIGDGASVNLYNPLGRNVTLQILQVNTNTVLGTYTGTYQGVVNGEFKTTDAINRQYASIPNSNSGTYYAKVTYGSVVKTLGNKTYYTKVSECSPSFTSFNTEDSNADIVAVTGSNQVYVKGYSKLKISIPSTNKMTTQKSATPNKYVMSCDTLNDEVAYSTSNITKEIGTIVNSGTLRVNVRAYDSRNNPALAYKDITVYDYSKPVINVSATRLNRFENETTIKVSGTYTKLTINNTDKNAITNVKYRYRETGGNWSSWTNIGTVASNGTFTCSDVILSLDNTKSFEFEIQATDRIDNNTRTVNVDIGQAIFFISSNNRACYINGQEILQYDVVDTW